MELPNKEDLSKLHNEINQYLNQRFTVTMTAITISGVALGWIIQQANSKLENPATIVEVVASDPDPICFLSLVLIVILIVLFLVTWVIQRSIITISLYLQVTRASTWERDNAKLSQAGLQTGWSGQDEVVLLIFAFLGLLAVSTPIALHYWVGSKELPAEFCWTYGLIIAMSVYWVAIALFSQRNKPDRRFQNKAKIAWQKLKLPVAGVDLKLDQIWVNETCGLEIKIMKECSYSRDESMACEKYSCLPCWDGPLKLKN